MPAAGKTFVPYLQFLVECRLMAGEESVQGSEVLRVMQESGIEAGSMRIKPEGIYRIHCIMDEITFEELPEPHELCAALQME